MCCRKTWHSPVRTPLSRTASTTSEVMSCSPLPGVCTVRVAWTIGTSPRRDTTEPMPSDYERLGGREAVRQLVDAFLDQVFSDFVIGFHFEGRDQDRIRRHELEHAIALLGGPDAYAGRPIGAVHQPLKINRGQFRRRLVILRSVLGTHGVPEDIIERWVAHDARLEPAITDGTDCTPEP